MNISAGCETGVEAGVSILEELTKSSWWLEDQQHLTVSQCFFAEMYRLNVISQKATMVQQVWRPGMCVKYAEILGQNYWRTQNLHVERSNCCSCPSTLHPIWKLTAFTTWGVHRFFEKERHLNQTLNFAVKHVEWTRGVSVLLTHHQLLNPKWWRVGEYLRAAHLAVSCGANKPRQRL